MEKPNENKEEMTPVIGADEMNRQIAEAVAAMREQLKAEVKAEVEANIKKEAKASPKQTQTAENAVKAMVGSMKERLAACPKVKVKLPVSELNPKDLTVTVQINGYTYTIKRGEEVEVPNVVKDLLERGGYY